MSSIDTIMDNALNSDEDLSPDNIMLNAVEQVNSAVSEMQDCSAMMIEKAQQLANHERQIASSDTLGHFKLGSGFEIDEENRININGTADFNTALQTLNTELQAKIDAIPDIVDATASVKGIVELATNAEVITGTNTTKAITPANLQAKIDALELSNIEVNQDFINSSISWSIPDYDNIITYEIPSVNTDINKTAPSDGVFIALMFGHRNDNIGSIKINGNLVAKIGRVMGESSAIHTIFPVQAGDICTYRTGLLNTGYQYFSAFAFAPFKGVI